MQGNSKTHDKSEGLPRSTPKIPAPTLCFHVQERDGVAQRWRRIEDELEERGKNAMPVSSTGHVVCYRTGRLHVSNEPHLS